MDPVRLEFIIVLAVFFATIATNGFFFSRTLRHNTYLQWIISELEHGRVKRNFWDQKCAHCGRRLRDSATAMSEYATPDGGRVTAVFHSGKPACLAGYRHYQAQAAAIVASWSEGEDAS